MAHSDALRRAAELRQTAEESRSKAVSKAGELAKLQQELDDLNREASQNEAAAAAALAAAGGAPRGPIAPVIPPASSRSWYWSDGSPTWLGLLALVLAALALILSIIALNSGYLDRKGVTDLVNGAVLPVARDAADAKSTANRALADASQAKADATNAVSTANDAKVAAAACKCKPETSKAPAKPHRRPVKPAQAPLLPLAPAPVPVVPPVAQAPRAVLPAGGCIYSSDGTAVLKGTSVRQPKGTELARISDAELMSSANPAIRGILVAHPDGFATNNGHLAMCKAWSDYVATQIQSPEGLRVHNDTHRVQ